MVDSAWIPWLLPIQRVCLCFLASLRSSFPKSWSPFSIILLDWFSWIEKEVSRISLEVRPLWINLDSVPTYLATLVKKAITSCRVFFSISSISFTLNLAFFLILFVVPFGIWPSFYIASHANISKSSQIWYLFWSSQISFKIFLEYLGINYKKSL